MRRTTLASFAQLPTVYKRAVLMIKPSFRAGRSLFAIAAASALGAMAIVAQPAIAAPSASNGERVGQAKNDTDSFYRQVRTDLESNLGALGQDYYTIYRIVERIARANGLDEQPWRIRVSTADVLNAYASELNVLTFEGGILEQLSGDTAAIACVVGHEMAHHTEGHGAERTEVAARLEALQIEALEEARAEVESANQRAGVFGAVIGVVSNTLGVNVARSSNTGRIAAGVTTGVLQGLNEDQANQAAARAEEIYEARVEELQDRYSGVSRANESEADEVGYQYVVRAGFEPAGCARAMGALTRTVTSRLPGITHPKPADRVAALTAMDTPANNQSLVAQGNANLSRSPKPLEYGFGRDGSSLRVESRYGSRDIDDGFPQ